MNLSLLISAMLTKKECNKLPILGELTVMIPIHYFTDLNFVSTVMTHYQYGHTVDTA